MIMVYFLLLCPVWWLWWTIALSSSHVFLRNISLTDNASICNFMENFELIPFDIPGLHNCLKDQGFYALSDVDSPLLEAVWSVIQSFRSFHRFWRLENITFDEFQQKFLHKLEDNVSRASLHLCLSVILQNSEEVWYWFSFVHDKRINFTQ